MLARTAQDGKTGWRRNATALERHDALLNEWRGAGVVDIAMLTLAARHLAAFGA